jgi:hypothetical protein
MVGIGELLTEEEAAGNGAFTSGVTGGSCSKVLLHHKGRTVVWLAGFDCDEEAEGWRR